MITNTGIKAYRKTDQGWERIRFVSTTVDFSDKVMPLCGGSLVFSGKATIGFIDDVGSISKDLRMEPKIEKWKSNGKRKMPRIK